MKWDIPVPERLYSSPLSRAVHTAVISFTDIIFESSSPTANPIATIKEVSQTHLFLFPKIDRPKEKTRILLLFQKLREHNGVSLCDKRSPLSHIVKNYPQFIVEEGFTEEDELWRPDHRENDDELVLRLREALDEIFSESPPVCEFVIFFVFVV